MVALEIIGGLLLLGLGGEGLVRGGIGIARTFGLSRLFVGAVIVSIGTSAPELVVAINAVLSGEPDIATGNVVGSNISNVFLVLALGALIYPIAIHRNTVFRDGAVLLGASGLTVWIAQTQSFSSTVGTVFLGLLALYIVVLLITERQSNSEPIVDNDMLTQNFFFNLVIAAVGAVALMFGAHYLVTGATALAIAWDVPPSVIGLSLVAVGTSLPELAATSVAAWRRNPEIAAGNIIGSGIFNLFGILGVTALISANPVTLPNNMIQFDVWWMLAASVVIIPFLASNWRLSRLEGVFLLTLYVGYLTILFGYVTLQ